jgi:hypothetical protein
MSPLHLSETVDVIRQAAWATAARVKCSPNVDAARIPHEIAKVLNQSKTTC